MLSSSHAKWPKPIELDPRRQQLEALLAQDQRVLWDGGELRVAHLSLNPELEKTLIFLHQIHQLERGLENIERVLTKEKKGLSMLHERQGGPPAPRISRLLIIADGGSERFYRNCERVLKEHKERLLGVRLSLAASPLLMEELFGQDALAKLLLISHRDAVTRALWSLLS